MLENASSLHQVKLFTDQNNLYLNPKLMHQKCDFLKTYLAYYNLCCNYCSHFLHICSTSNKNMSNTKIKINYVISYIIKIKPLIYKHS